MLENGPRATPERFEDEVDRLRSITRLETAYNDLRHSDFCDVVAEAVRRRNLSDQDATHAAYVREWVSSGAALRTTFSDWLASEGQAHIMQLNGEWLRNGERHQSFSGWLVGASAAGVRETAEKSAFPPRTEIWGSNWSSIPNKPVEGRWRQEGAQLVCEHKVIAVFPEQIATSVRVTCSVSRYLNGTLSTNLCIDLKPYLHLVDDGEPFAPHLVKPPFVLGLVADGTGQGTESDPLIQGGIFELNACASGDEPETAALSIVSSKDTMLAVRTLGLGTNLTLTLLDYESEPPIRLRLKLRGDPSFARLYERLRSSV